MVGYRTECDGLPSGDGERQVEDAREARAVAERHVLERDGHRRRRARRDVGRAPRVGDARLRREELDEICAVRRGAHEHRVVRPEHREGPEELEDLFADDRKTAGVVATRTCSRTIERWRSKSRGVAATRRRRRVADSLRRRRGGVAPTHLSTRRGA